MASNTREIRRRIKSVKNIGQITKAMELVSAAKMRKAQNSALSSRPYSRIASELMKNVMAKAGSTNHPLLNRPQSGAGRKLIILITSDKGLAGSLNTNAVNTALRLARQEGGKANFDFLTVGKKGTDVAKRLGFNIIATLPSRDKDVTIFDAKAVAQIAIQDYLSEKYDRVYVVYTDFISTLSQKSNVFTLLPLYTEQANNSDEYLFEPGADSILEKLIARSIEFSVYQALVESVASEHSARMVAMRNANQAAGDLIDDLQLFYNQARQAGITRELAEISAAKLAMEG